MYRYCSLIGWETSHEKINYLCLKCMEFCTFEAESASNVQILFSDWLRQWNSASNVQNRPQMYRILTLDSNSTSDRNLSDVLKIMLWVADLETLENKIRKRWEARNKKYNLPHSATVFFYDYFLQFRIGGGLLLAQFELSGLFKIKLIFFKISFVKIYK